MVRVYTQMGDLQAGQRLNRSDFTLDMLLEKTKAVVAPHTMDFCYVDWYTCYEVGIANVLYWFETALT
jgi:phenol 2-monooxygenase